MKKSLVCVALLSSIVIFSSYDNNRYIGQRPDETPEQFTNRRDQENSQRLKEQREAAKSDFQINYDRAPVPPFGIPVQQDDASTN